MTPSLLVFINKILKVDDDTAQIIRHEAGHRLMWRIMRPERKTKYAVVDGLPCVRMADETQNKPYKIDSLSIEDASKLAYIKLAGIAAEMLLLDITSETDILEIARFIANDYTSLDSIIDWHDDADHGGDIPQACEIIGRKVGWHSLESNLAVLLKSCLENLRANMADLILEEAEATKILKERK